MQNPSSKYHPFPKIGLPNRQWPDQVIDKAPIWCSVDLRDGNQALSNPMNIKEKLEMFDLLVKIGFKEIEVGFPSASKVEFDFIRHLVEHKCIPEDVTIQILTQARQHLIQRSFESIKGVKKAIVHLYNPTSPLQRRITFAKDKTAIKQIAVEGTQLVKSLVPSVPDTGVRFEYSPESFSDTEVDYALEVCEAVMEAWEPSVDNPIILNLPATVEWATPNVYADQIEWFCRHMRERDKAIISLHTHNDRGTGIAATELGLMAGADRVEGTLFGNGERTGNLDIITVALNMYSQGVDPGLELNDILSIRKIYERCTGMPVPARQPYGGDLVFTAFSGSHQDAIKKGMDLRKKENSEKLWQVPYLSIDPQDIGRTYEAIIRINSQSGKGGIAYIMANEFDLDLPKTLQPEFGETVNKIADRLGRELSSKEIFEAFQNEYLNRESPLKLVDFAITAHATESHTVSCRAKVVVRDQILDLEGEGNGPINAFVHALEQQKWKCFKLVDFRQHAMGSGSGTEAAAYVQIELNHQEHIWGAGIDTNIDIASIKALVSAFNRGQRLLDEEDRIG